MQHAEGESPLMGIALYLLVCSFRPTITASVGNATMRTLFVVTLAIAFALPIAAQAGGKGGGAGKISAGPTGTKGGSGTKKPALCDGVCGESSDDKHKGVIAR